MKLYVNLNRLVLWSYELFIGIVVKNLLNFFDKIRPKILKEESRNKSKIPFGESSYLLFSTTRLKIELIVLHNVDSNQTLFTE